MPGDILAKACGVSAFNATLAALHRYLATGQKEQIHVSCMHVLAGIVPTLRTQLDKPEERYGGPGHEGLGVRLYNFGGSQLSFNFALGNFLESLLDIIGLDETHVPETLSNRENRQDFAVLRDFIESLPSPFDAHELFTIISSPPHSSAVGKVLKPAETIVDEQLASLPYWQSQQHPKLGMLKRTGPPARLSMTPARTTVPPQPFDTWQERSLRVEKGTPLVRPLEGIKIVDLTQAWIGPFASQLLCDLGADIIKVESLSKPDVWRKLPPHKPPNVTNPDAQVVNCSYNFNTVNRDKRSLTLGPGKRNGTATFSVPGRRGGHCDGELSSKCPAETRSRL